MPPESPAISAVMKKAEPMRSQGLIELHGRMLRAWQLALLRFAVTMDHSDRINVLAIANEIDRGGREAKESADFGFFRKTSTELCAAILRQTESADAILRQYLGRLEDDRLTRAFAAAIEMDDQVPAMRKPKIDKGLWRGLSSRGNAPSSAG
jgi:hypothetical protein